MKLVATDAPVLFEILITKDEFIIGKKAELVDGVISFNRMISRSHCKIIHQENQYLIVDLKSANGTYLNGIRLQPDQLVRSKMETGFDLQNSEFQVVIG